MSLAKMMSVPQSDTTKAYKLFTLRRDGTLGPLFINRRQRIPYDTWLPALNYPTKGYKVRPGWHVTKTPLAPHLSKKGRVWRAVEITDFKKLERPASQGGTWLLANWMRVLPEPQGRLRTKYVFNPILESRRTDAPKHGLLEWLNQEAIKQASAKSITDDWEVENTWTETFDSKDELYHVELIANRSED